MTGKVAVFTMIYNEQEYLPIWLKYYSSQVGAKNCFIIDHGSDDGSADNLVCGGILHLPRTPQDENKRVDTISNYSSSFLNYYDAVIYTDVDEILVANPINYEGLTHFCSMMNAQTVSAVGLNLHHMIDEELDFDTSKSVLSQRSWVRFVSPMCKPLITRVPIRWGRGFHSSDQVVVFDEIYLFHLRYFDLKIGLSRLARTRVHAHATDFDIKAAQHQRLPDEDFEKIMRTVTSMNREEVQFSLRLDPVKSSLSQALDASGRINMSVFANRTWRIPSQFKSAF